MTKADGSDQDHGDGAPDPGSGPGRGRHLVLIRDRHGLLWLAPPGVDENGDLQAQGCWRCDGPALATLVGYAPANGR